VAPQARGFAIAFGTAALVCFVVGWGALGWVLAGLTAFNFAFFRNPRRVPPLDPHTILAPGDGRVVEVTPLDEADPFVGRAQRVAIFLSVFDVHINHAPVSGKVRAITRSGTKFKAAFDGKASALNVQSRLDLETADGLRMGVVQITGLIARRIVCYAQLGDTLERGDPYGLICYGSRMELILPADCAVRVRRGDRVRSGESVVAEVEA
jgi:phosphatidylserine decarboxylase